MTNPKNDLYSPRNAPLFLNLYGSFVKLFEASDPGQDPLKACAPSFEVARRKAQALDTKIDELAREQNSAIESSNDTWMVIPSEEVERLKEDSSFTMSQKAALYEEIVSSTTTGSMPIICYATALKRLKAFHAGIFMTASLNGDLAAQKLPPEKK